MELYLSFLGLFFSSPDLVLPILLFINDFLLFFDFPLIVLHHLLLQHDALFIGLDLMFAPDMVARSDEPVIGVSVFPAQGDDDLVLQR